MAKYLRQWHIQLVIVSAAMLNVFFLLSVSIFPESGSFNVDSVRVCKILVSSHHVQTVIIYYSNIDPCIFYLLYHVSLSRLTIQND